MYVWYYIYPHGFETIITRSLSEALDICAGLCAAGQAYSFRSLATDTHGEMMCVSRTDYDVE